MLDVCLLVTTISVGTGNGVLTQFTIPIGIEQINITTVSVAGSPRMPTYTVSGTTLTFASALTGANSTVGFNSEIDIVSDVTYSVVLAYPMVVVQILVSKLILVYIMLLLWITHYKTTTVLELDN